MRRATLPLAITAGAVIATVVALAAVLSSSAEAATQTTIIRWGPYTVPAAAGGVPGQTHNGFDFNIAKPCSDCYITGIVPNLVYENGQAVNFNTGGMLHHMVLFSNDREDVTCGTTGVGGIGNRVFASGNERTSSTLPDGYGYYVGPTDNWTLIHDLMNMTTVEQEYYLEFTFTYRPGSDNLKPVTPVWLDVVNCGSSEYAVPSGYTDTQWDWTSTLEGDVVRIGGHVHNYGISIAAEDVTTGDAICTSLAGYASGSPYAPGPGSGSDALHPAAANAFSPGSASYMGRIEDMTDCRPMTRINVGDTIRLHTQYNAPTAQDDVMGIMVAYVHETTGPTVTPTPTPSGPTPTPTPPLADTDEDGCPDSYETGGNPAQGGMRDPSDHWDFFDVWTRPPSDPTSWTRDKVVTIIDVLAVAGRFGPGPVLSEAEAHTQSMVAPADGTSYHPAFDRGPLDGPNMWDRSPPDGAINIPDDILGTAHQFGHSCV